MRGHTHTFTIGPSYPATPPPRLGYLEHIEHLNSIYDSEQEDAIRAINSKRKRGLEDVQRKYEQRYQEALKVVKELGPFFGGFGDLDEPCPLPLFTETELFEPGEGEGKVAETIRVSSKDGNEFMVNMACCICMDAFRDTRLVCNHVSMCMECALKSKKMHMATRGGERMAVEDFWCPICRKFSARASKVYFS
jgi:hypothetical protein